MLKEAKAPVEKARITKQKVAAAATDCFKRFGVHRTSMNDIADAMNVSRQSVYRVFENRSLLLEYIATKRIKIMSDKLKEFLKSCNSFYEAVVTGMPYQIKVAQDDKLLHEILLQQGDAHFKTFVFGGAHEVHMLLLDAYGSFIRKARDDGSLIPAATDLEVVEWLTNIGSMLNNRDDYDEHDHRRILEKFVIPGLVRKPPEL